MGIDRITPKVVCDLFTLLSDDNKTVFLRMLAGCIPADAIFDMVRQLTPLEAEKFTKRVSHSNWSAIYPQVVKVAVRQARANLLATDGELERAIDEELQKAAIEDRECLRALEREKLKQKRDRKPDPAKVRRNVEICDLRKRSPGTWSQGALAKRFDLTDSDIRKILKDEAKWRRLLAAHQS